jgi:hypothetical protein
MNDASRAAGRAGREIVLLDQQRAPSGARAFPRNGDTIDSAADHQHMKVLVLE